MSDLKDKYQQQILFESLNDTNNKADNLDIKTQLIFNNDDWQDATLEQLEPQLESPEPLNIKKKPRWLWRIVALLFSSLLVIEAVDYFSVGFVESPFTTGIVAAILACLSFVAVAALFRELTGLKQFKQQQNIQEQVRLVVNSHEDILPAKQLNARDLCEQITNNLPCDLLFEQEHQWQDILQSEHDEKEILQLYARTVLTKVDQKAISEIAKFSTEAVVLVALSPVAIIDMMIMLWRNLRMINKVAGLYGLKLSYWSRIKLIKQIFINMAYAGASEILTDVGADMLGADLLGKLSGRLAQGLGAGMLTARLGLRTLKLCRPIPFDCIALNSTEPKINIIRREIINQVTTLIKNKPR